jgi:hypothetical protein
MKKLYLKSSYVTEFLFLLIILLLIIVYYYNNDSFKGASSTTGAPFVYNTLTPVDYINIPRPIDYKKHLEIMYKDLLNPKLNDLKDTKPKLAQTKLNPAKANEADVKQIIYTFDTTYNKPVKPVKVRNYCDYGNRFELELCNVNDIL